MDRRRSSTEREWVRWRREERKEMEEEEVSAKAEDETFDGEEVVIEEAGDLSDTD
jgi:hypothetical protein